MVLFMPTTIFEPNNRIYVVTPKGKGIIWLVTPSLSYNSNITSSANYKGSIIGYLGYTSSARNLYGENGYLAYYMYRASVFNSYLYNGTGNGYSSIYYGEAEITMLQNLELFDFEASLGFNSLIWDFSGVYPTLINLDNTPVYTPEENQSTTGLTETLPIINFTSAAIDDLSLGDEIPFVLQLENTSDLYVYSITVNGVEISTFRDTSTNKTIIFDIPTGEAAGALTFTISEIKVYYNGEVYSYVVNENNEVLVKVFKDIEVMSVEATDGNPTAQSYSNKQLTITLDNSEAYTVESLVIGGVTYTKDQFITSDSSTIILNFPVSSSSNNGVIRRYYVSSITYSDGVTNRTIEKIKKNDR